MGTPTDFIEVLPHAAGLNKGPHTRQFLKDTDTRMWQVSGADSLCEVVMMGDKVPENLRTLSKGEHVIRDFCYIGDMKTLIGWLIFKDGVFLGVEVVWEGLSQECSVNEKDYPEELIKTKYGVTAPHFHYNYVH